MEDFLTHFEKASRKYISRTPKKSGKGYDYKYTDKTRQKGDEKGKFGLGDRVYVPYKKQSGRIIQKDFDKEGDFMRYKIRLEDNNNHSSKDWWVNESSIRGGKKEIQ